MDQQVDVREGMTVFGADSNKLGTVVAVDPRYLVVEKGFFFPSDYYVPTTAVARVDQDDIYLTVSKEEALNQGWDQPILDGDDTPFVASPGEPVRDTSGETPR